MTDPVLVALGLVLLLAGGEALVRGAAGLALRLGLSPLVIGVTVMGFGTSAPELVTSLSAALKGSPGIAAGNVVGSNIANILLILGAAALLAPLLMDRAAARREAVVLGIATAFGTLLMLGGALTRGDGALLLAGLGLYLWVALRSGAAEAGDAPAPDPAGRTVLLLGLGFGGILLGANWLVDGAVGIARTFGMTETVIGLTLVAVGTSLPELVTSLLAARKREGALALGNILGSNAFNLLGILGVTALVSPLAVPAGILGRDLWIMGAVTLGLAALLWARGGIGRAAGAVCLAGYVGYTLWLLV